MSTQYARRHECVSTRKILLLLYTLIKKMLSVMNYVSPHRTVMKHVAMGDKRAARPTYQYNTHKAFLDNTLPIVLSGLHAVFRSAAVHSRKLFLLITSDTVVLSRTKQLMSILNSDY